MPPLLLLPLNLDKLFCFPFLFYFLFISFSTPFSGGLLSVDLSPLVSLPFVFLYAHLSQWGSAPRYHLHLFHDRVSSRRIWSSFACIFLFDCIFLAFFSTVRSFPRGVFPLFPSFFFFLSFSFFFLLLRSQ